MHWCEALLYCKAIKSRAQKYNEKASRDFTAAGSRLLRDVAIRAHARIGFGQNGIPGDCTLPITISGVTARFHLGSCGKGQRAMAMTLSEERAIAQKYIAAFPG